MIHSHLAFIRKRDEETHDKSHPNHYTLMFENQLPRFPTLPLESMSFNELIVGTPAIGSCSPPPPPPRSGFAILDPPPKANDWPDMESPKPRVEPAFAVSRRSFTAVSWTSNLVGNPTLVSDFCYNRGSS
jgi:hypothetical protein